MSKEGFDSHRAKLQHVQREVMQRLHDKGEHRLLCEVQKSRLVIRRAGDGEAEELFRRLKSSETSED